MVANGTPSQGNLYLLDGMYNNDDRLGGSQGTQVRVVLDNIEEYQVVEPVFGRIPAAAPARSSTWSPVAAPTSLGGWLHLDFRDERFNTRGHFLADGAPKPDERTLQARGSRSADRSSRTARTSTSRWSATRRLPGPSASRPRARALARDFVGAFTVDAMNYFGRGDLQINQKNFFSVRWVLETAQSQGEGFNANTQTTDAQQWENDWDQLFSATYTAVLSDRASNVIRVGPHRRGTRHRRAGVLRRRHQVHRVRRPRPVLDRPVNVHPSYTTGTGGLMVRTRIRTYALTTRSAIFLPSRGRAHVEEDGRGLQPQPDAAADDG